MIVIDIPIQIFVNRIEKLLRMRNDPLGLAKMLYDIVSISPVVDTLRIVQTFSATTIIFGSTVIEFEEDKDRKWLSRYIAYQPTEKEYEELEKVK